MGGLGDDAAAPQTSTARVWSFAGCVLDERSLELKVHNQVTDLDRKPLEVLIHLLRHAGEVVTKDELAEAVWSGRIITDSNLTKTMAVLRATLGDGAATIIKTVHGYGYRLMAPVSVQAHASEPAPARFDFKPGESPPLRPLWQLSSHLGTGGHGEVWLAHHSKTKEPRVFKFAEGGSALTALKREITLNRLLRETLPGRDDYLRLLDWNFEHPPFFVESEYAASGSLAAWAELQGGLSKIPLETRLDLLAQAAEALAAAHSIGVLHKDLKPTNILIGEKDGKPRIKLADFGSGAVLDSSALDALGITAMGFTQKVSATDTTSGTPLYLAPEIIAGQPFTVQSDIYALGVMLYQLVAGDTRKSLAPGWEKDIADELLREDIAETAAGNPTDRLGDAAQLAQRLRTLEQRRAALTAQRADAAAAQRAAVERVELRRLRVMATVLVGATAVSLMAGLVAVKSRDEALRSARTAEAVSNFLNRDLLAGATPTAGPATDMNLRRLLDRAAKIVDERFTDEPLAAAEVHLTVAEAYRQLGELDLMQTELQRAIARATQAGGADSIEAQRGRLALGQLLTAQGKSDEGCPMVAEVLQRFEQVLAAEDPKLFQARLAQIGCRGGIGWDPVALRAVIADMDQVGLGGSNVQIEAYRMLGISAFDRSDYAEAERGHRQVLEAYIQRYGADHTRVALQRVIRAGALTFLGRLDEADAEFERAFADERAWSGDAAVINITQMTIFRTLLRVEQGRFADAEADVRTCLDSPLGKQRGGHFRLSSLSILAQTLLEQGRVEDSLRALDEALAYLQEMKASNHYAIILYPLQADAFLRLGRTGDAAQALAHLTPEVLAEVPADSWRMAYSLRSQGLLLRAQGDAGGARRALERSRDIYRARYGLDHWRTQRAARELSPS